MSDVKVRRRVVLPLGGAEHVTDWSMSRATADVFDPGVLTISADDTGEVLRTFQPDDWESVSVFGEDGFEDFSFRNDTAWQGHVESRDRRKSA